MKINLIEKCVKQCKEIPYIRKECFTSPDLAYCEYMGKKMQGVRTDRHGVQRFYDYYECRRVK